METIVQLMDEPFCNVGIVIATWLLAEAAKGTVSHIFSGDGGDELFGGHPVYVADKAAALVDGVAEVVRRPVFALLRRLPDSDRKLSLGVKLKRFAESMSFPARLGTNRWRLYYGPSDLRRLLLGEGATDGELHDALFADVLAVGEGADGPDRLSRSLHVDYLTELGFSLRRMGLLRHFGLEPALPLLDHRLVEYAATIPSSLKIRGFSDTKYVQRVAMEGLLPDRIVHREDKLGHSIPFKNWLRGDEGVRRFVQQLLSEETIRRRGLVDAKFVQQLWDDHQSRRRNNSHRLWTLAVLELWMAHHNLSA
jgi:asparagine synthase (glutamine-hydrolysing)